MSGCASVQSTRSGSAQDQAAPCSKASAVCLPAAPYHNPAAGAHQIEQQQAIERDCVRHVVHYRQPQVAARGRDGVQQSSKVCKGVELKHTVQPLHGNTSWPSCSPSHAMPGFHAPCYQSYMRQPAAEGMMACGLPIHLAIHQRSQHPLYTHPGLALSC